jgi:anti-sigma regulatory factor (Ser/Thr protein kinase)
VLEKRGKHSCVSRPILRSPQEAGDCSLNGVLDTWGSLELPNSIRAPSLARRFATAVLVSHGLTVLVPDARLMLSELVTNAVVHAHSRSILRIEHVDSILRILVTDFGSDWEPQSEPTEGGRGLRIVRQLATRWGVEHSAGSKTVWFDLSTRPIGGAGTS